MIGARVLVTGASRGIGAALVEALGKAGAEPIGAARSGGPGVLRCDVTIPSEVEALRARTGPVDLLVNNAGVIHAPAPLVEIPAAEWERLFAVNVHGMVAMLRAYLPAMNERGEGAVLNLSSGWGRFAEGRQAPYCATKFAVEALTAALARETAPGVLVAAVNPGVVATEMLATCFGGDLTGFTSPGSCAASLVRLLTALGPEHHGRSLDAERF